MVARRVARHLASKILAVALTLSLCFGLVAIPTLAFAQQPPERQNSTREFMLSATYGALAGGLVGGATLAFSDKPSDNLSKVARGASLGLYAGILLGLYVVYGGSGNSSDDDDDSALLNEPSLIITPVVTDRGLEGAEARYSVLEF